MKTVTPSPTSTSTPSQTSPTHKRAAKNTKSKTRRVPQRMSNERIGMLIRLIILTWSGGLLTMYYLGGLQRLDTTFIGGLLTQTLAAFGISLAERKRDDDDDDDKKGGLRKTEPMMAPPVSG